MNGGRKAKNPNELIKEVYKYKPQKQSFEEGLKDIEKIKMLEQNS